MASPPPWGFRDLAPHARWVLAHGLPTLLAAPETSLDPAAWQQLRSVCARHELEGLLVDAVAGGALPTTDAQRIETAELELRLTRSRMRYEQLLATPLAVLAAVGVEVRVLKGVAMAQLEYPDEQLRPTGDIDLLVRTAEIDRAVAALVGAGGNWIDPEPAPGWIRLVAKGATVRLPPPGLEVDLHRLLVWGPFGVRLPPEELWQVSRRLTVGDLDLVTVGREEMLLHACAHLLVLGTVRAREARDVAQIVCNPALDAGRVLSLARRWDQEALLATALVMSERELVLCPDAHPLQAWARGYPVKLRDRLWLRTEAPVDRPHGIEQAAVWWELGPGPARRVLWRANLRPLPGTYPGPLQRTRRLVDRLARGRQVA